jgi:glutathione S-transferase
MKLYYSPGACSMASHVILQEIGKPFELERVDIVNKVTEHGADYRAVNAKGSVPALDIGGGEVLTEGAAILQFIADSNGATELAPPVGTLARARMQEVLNFVASELHKAFGPLFIPGKSEAEQQAARDAVARNFDWLESRLSDGRAFLTGAVFTVADAYAFVIANWANAKNMSLANWPRLKDFVDRVAARPTVQAVMRAEGLA